MKNSTLLAMLLLLLIASAGSFAGGFFVGKGQATTTNVVTPPIADSTTHPELSGSPLQGKSQPAPEPPPVDNATNTAGDSLQQAVPGTTPEAGSGAGNPANTSPFTPAKPKSGATVPGETAPAAPMVRGMLEPAEFEDAFGGPRVDVSASISGTVVDQRGSPVAGARVMAEFGETLTSEGNETMRVLVRSSSVGEAGRQIATTDAAGYFSADISHKVPEKATLTLGLTAQADGYAGSRKTNLTIRNGDNKENIKLALRGAGNVGGRVVDANGAGVPGVSVSLRATGGDSGSIEIEMGDFGGGQYSATTDGAGEFLIKGVPEGRYRFRLRSIGVRQTSGPTEIDVADGQDARAAAEFVVAATAALRVTFTDPDGKPASGWATVVVKDGDRTVKRLQGPVSSKGIFEANDPPAGSFTLEISLWGYKLVSAAGTFAEGVVTDLGHLSLEPSAETPPNGIFIPGED